MCFAGQVAKSANKMGVFAAFLAILPTYVLYCIQTCPTHTNGGGIGCDIIVYVIPLADAVFCLLPTQGIQKTQREWVGGGGGVVHAWKVNTCT